KGAGAMAHRVELKIAERDLLHLAISRMILDKIFINAKSVARVQDRGMAVGDACELIEPAPRQSAEALHLRDERVLLVARQIERQQTAQGVVDVVEVQTCAIRSDLGEERSGFVLLPGSWPGCACHRRS